MKQALVLLFILLKLSFGQPVDSLTVYSMMSKNNIDFTTTVVDQKVASYLVINTNTATAINTVIAFANGCNVTHFRRSNLTIPLTSVVIKVNNATVVTATPATPPCSAVYSWSPAGPAPYLDKYQVDIYISWTGIPMTIAGTYSETLSFWAYK